jgi:hypothetical protein
VFGYVRPHYPELRVRELELYRAAYCGLCDTIGRRFGLLPRGVLAYDFVFLTLLLTDGSIAPKTAMKRCPLSFKRRRCLDCGATSDYAAALGVILAYHKLRDDIADEKFAKRTAARLYALTLRRAYTRAATEYPAFDDAARTCLSELSRIETDASQPLDALADCFARLLTAAVPESTEPSRKRIFETLLYHVGRFVYIIDARDDVASDTANHRPNAITARQSRIDDARLGATLTNSLNIAGSALELLPETEYSGILRNILYLGLPAVQSAVFDGTFDKTPRLGKRERLR